MTPHPDPVRASFEAWTKDAGELAGPTGPQCLDLKRASEKSEWCYFYARTELAYRAYTAAYRAASRVSELERAVVEAADAYVGECDEADADDTPEGALYLQLIQSVTDLRLHRTPPKVDRVQAALDALGKLGALPSTNESLMAIAHFNAVRDLLAAELRERTRE